MKILIVGAGYAGSVMAEQLAQAGHKILIIDKRSHIAGNAYDEYDAHGILVHRYGPHIFHTNAQRIFDYLSQFTQWRFYEHRVRACVNERLYPFPINRDTLNQLYGLNLTENEAVDFFERVREPRDPVLTSEDVVLNSVGQDLYEKFFLNYTRKQWGMDPSQLKAGVAARIPVRTNTDDRYFTDDYQFMPLHGYTKMFEAMLDHPNIQVELNTDFQQLRKHTKSDLIIYTGPMDTYFDYCYGHLPYRSLRFEYEHLAHQAFFQGYASVNYPNDHAFTRITEFKYLTGQVHMGTSIVREYPQADGDPYYPVPNTENELLFKKYEALALKEKNTVFVGRLAQYRYYNMDQVVGAALAAAKNVLENSQ